MTALKNLINKGGDMIAGQGEALGVNYSRDRAVLWLFLTPAIIFMLFANVYPLGYAIVMSFFQYNRLIPGAVPVFNGIRNYIDLITDPQIIDSFTRTILFVAVTVVVEFLIGTAIALLITTTIKGMKIIRGFFLIPLMMPFVVAGTLWRTLYNALYGPINYFISWFGLPQLEWLGNPDLALPAVMITEVWQQTPIVIFILAAGIQALPVDIYQSAMVDGAGRLQILRKITLPLLKPVFFVALLLRIMDAFRIFDTIYVMTYGGPGKSTEVLSLFIYKEGLKYFKIGRASALSVMFLILVLIATIGFLRNIQKQQL